MFVLAYVFFLRSPEPQPAPVVGAVSGSSVWRYQDQAQRLIRRGSFAAQAGEDVVRQLMASGPDGGPAVADRTHSPLDYAGLSAIARSAATDHDRGVGIKPLEQDGRRLWRAAMRFGDQMAEVVVDQATGTVRWAASQGADAGLPSEEFEVTSIRYGAAPSAAPGHGELFVPEESGGEQYFPSLAAAAQAAGFAPAVSTLAPDGYELAAAGVARSGRLDGLEAAPTKQTRRLDLLYVRDLSAFWVSQLPADDAAAARLAAAAADPAALAYGATPVSYGLFAGTQAATWFAPRGPTMLLTGAGYAVLVRGGLTRQELLDLSEGFARRE